MRLNEDPTQPISIAKAYEEFMADSKRYLENLEKFNLLRKKQSLVYFPENDSNSEQIKQASLFSSLMRDGLIKNLSEDEVFTISKEGETANPILEILTKTAQEELTLTQKYLLLRQIAILRTTNDPLNDQVFSNKIKNEKTNYKEDFSTKILKATYRDLVVFNLRVTYFSRQLKDIYSELSQVGNDLTDFTVRALTGFIKNAHDYDEAYVYLLATVSDPSQLSSVELIIKAAYETAIKLITWGYNPAPGSREEQAFSYFKVKNKNTFTTRLSNTERLIKAATPHKQLGRPIQRKKENYDALTQALQEYQKLVDFPVYPEDLENKTQKLASLADQLKPIIQEVIREAGIVVGVGATQSQKTLLEYDLALYPRAERTPIHSSLNPSIEELAMMLPLLVQIRKLFVTDTLKSCFHEKLSKGPGSKYYGDFFNEIFATLFNPVIQSSVIKISSEAKESFDELAKDVAMKKHWQERMYLHVLKSLVYEEPDFPANNQEQFLTSLCLFGVVGFCSDEAKQAIKQAYLLYGIDGSKQPHILDQLELTIFESCSDSLATELKNIKNEIDSYSDTDQVALARSLRLSNESNNKLEKIESWLQEDSNLKWTKLPNSSRTKNGYPLNECLKAIFYGLLSKRSIGSFKKNSILEILHALLMEEKTIGLINVPKEILAEMKRIEAILKKLGDDTKTSDVGMLIRVLTELQKGNLASDSPDYVKLSTFVKNHYIMGLVADQKRIKAEIDKPITKTKLIAIVYALTYLINANRLDKSFEENKLVKKVALLWQKIMNQDSDSALPFELDKIARENCLPYLSVMSNNDGNKFDSTFNGYFDGLVIHVGVELVGVKPNLRDKAEYPELDEEYNIFDFYNGLRWPNPDKRDAPVRGAGLFDRQHQDPVGNPAVGAPGFGG